MKRLLIIPILALMVLAALAAPTPSALPEASVTGYCSTCCSWMTDCAVGFRCCDGESPCSTAPLQWGTCVKAKICPPLNPLTKGTQ